MLPDLRYRGYRIVWDTRQAPETLFWTGKAAVVIPADAAGVNRIHRVQGSSHFLREEDARERLIREAKEWIDNEIEGENLPFHFRPNRIEQHHAQK